MQTGYKYADEEGYDIAIQFDGDGQHNSMYLNDLDRLIICEQADLVVGSRFINNEGFQSSIFRRMGIRYFSLLIKILTGKKLTDVTSGFRACNKKVIKYFAYNYPSDYPEPESIVDLLKNDFTVKEIPVVMNERMHGKSSISQIKAVYYMLKVTLAILISYMR